MTALTGAGTDAVPARSVAGWYWLRWGIIATWVLIIATAAAVGQRSTSLHQLEDGLSTGRVRTVYVAGGVQGAEGYATQQLHWRQGLLQYRTEVLQVSPGTQAPTDTGDDVSAVRTGDIGAELASSYPAVHVIRDQPASPGASTHGWLVPGWLLLLGIIAGLLALYLLINGPPPWRATRWAWFWFWLMATPVGILAFLLLSGPTPPLPAPRDHTRRLTGGWAFVVSIPLGALFAHLW